MRSTPIAALLILGLTACGNDEVVPPPTSREPPPRPTGAAPANGPGRLFAVTHFFLGNGAADGTYAPDAWQTIGYDVDHENTTFDAIGAHCQPNAHASPKDVFPDGEAGIDNAFGKKVLPMLSIAVEGLPDDQQARRSLDDYASASLHDGDSTLLLWLSDLGDAKDASSLRAFALSARDRTPDGIWKVGTESLLDPAASGPAALATASAAFLDSYVTGDVWVSARSSGPLNFVVVLGGSQVRFVVHAPTITMKLSVDHTRATEGVISGVLDTEETVQEADRLIRQTATTKDICTGQAIDSIRNQVRQASDILLDGTQDPNATCDGISIGIGFEAEEATASGTADPPPLTDICAQ